jgi:hypothetical protein
MFYFPFNLMYPHGSLHDFTDCSGFKGDRAQGREEYP